MPILPIKKPSAPRGNAPAARGPGEDPLVARGPGEDALAARGPGEDPLAAGLI